MKRVTSQLGICRWGRLGKRWAVYGPATIVKPGAVVQVWNNKMRTFQPVLIDKVLSQGATSGDNLGFPSKKELPIQSEYEDAGAHCETLEEWRARQAPVL